MKLDKSKPYGQISGDLHGRHFEQNGKFFGIDGNEAPEVIEEPVEEEQDDEKAALRAEVEKLRAQLDALKPKAAGKGKTKAVEPAAETVKTETPAETVKTETGDTSGQLDAQLAQQ